MDDDVPAMSASIAYYSLLSLPPLLAIIVAIAGVFYGTDVVREALIGQMAGLVGQEGAAQMGEAMAEARETNGGFGGQIIGIGALLIGATAAFHQLQRSLNKAWNVEPDPEANAIKTFIFKRVLSFGMVLTVGFLLLASLVLSAAIDIVGDEIGAMIGGGTGWAFIRVANIVLPLVLFTFLFAGIFRVLPDAKIRWRDVWVGAAVTSVLFVIGKTLIGFYMGQANIAAGFGPAGPIVVVLVWIYFTALLLLIGAEFTQVWARKHGHIIQPDEGAVKVTEDRHPETPEELEREEEEIRRESEEYEREKGDGDKESGEVADSDLSRALPNRVKHPYTAERPPQPRSGINEEPEK